MNTVYWSSVHLLVVTLHRSGFGSKNTVPFSEQNLCFPVSFTVLLLLSCCVSCSPALCYTLFYLFKINCQIIRFSFVWTSDTPLKFMRVRLYKKAVTVNTNTYRIESKVQKKWLGTVATLCGFLVHIIELLCEQIFNLVVKFHQFRLSDLVPKLQSPLSLDLLLSLD